MDFKNLLLSFDGRIGRQSWWIGVIVLTVLQWIVMLILGLVFGQSMIAGMDPNMPPEQAAEIATQAYIPLIIASLIFLYPALALYAKRWHDRGKSGWWTLILLVPIIGFLWWLIEQGFLRGTDGPNQYGPDPVAG
jgi:uncharacterized membrane protein YhaH (DUF805 family)